MPRFPHHFLSIPLTSSPRHLSSTWSFGKSISCLSFKLLYIYTMDENKMARWGGEEEGRLELKMVRWWGFLAISSPPHHFLPTPLPPHLATSPFYFYLVIQDYDLLSPLVNSINTINRHKMVRWQGFHAISSPPRHFLPTPPSSSPCHLAILFLNGEVGRWGGREVRIKNGEVVRFPCHFLTTSPFFTYPPSSSPCHLPILFLPCYTGLWPLVSFNKLHKYYQ